MRISVLLPLAFILLASLPAQAQDRDDDTSLDDVPHVTMVGSAQIEAVPDLATISLGVTTEKPTAKGAADETARKAQAVVDAAKAQGVAATDIATQSVTLSQTFDDIRDGQGHVTGRKPRGYAAENIVSIRIRDLTNAGALAEDLIQKGANRFDGISFTVEHPEPILIKLTSEATKQARAQAEAAADAAGAKLGRVLLIARPGSERPAMPMARMAMKAAAPAMPVEAGTTTMGTQIEVTWALEAK